MDTTHHHQAETECAILQACPGDMAELLTGVFLSGLRGQETYPRQCLQAAHAVLTGAPGNCAAALPFIRGGLAHAIRPDHIECEPETVLLQVVFWLLIEDARQRASAGAKSSAFGQCQH